MSLVTSCIGSHSSPRVSHYQVEFAARAAERHDEYRLRYQVFVEERGWLTPSADAGGEECDLLDDASCAFLLRDTLTGEPAACQRFILPERLPAGHVTNVERVANVLGVDLGAFPSWAEVSRSSIAPRYRWGSAAAPLPAMVAIKYASVALAIALGREHLLSLSECRTARLARRLGFQMHQLAAPVDFHGRRALFHIEIAEVRRSIQPALDAELERLVASARARCQPLH